MIILVSLIDTSPLMAQDNPHSRTHTHPCTVAQTHTIIDNNPLSGMTKYTHAHTRTYFSSLFFYISIKMNKCLTVFTLQVKAHLLKKQLVMVVCPSASVCVWVVCVCVCVCVCVRVFVCVMCMCVMLCV